VRRTGRGGPGAADLAGWHLGPCTPRFRQPLQLAVLPMQNLGRSTHAVFWRHFRRPGPPWSCNRQANSRVCASPACKTPANPPPSLGNISRLGRHRQPSLRPLGERLTLASSLNPSHAGLPKRHVSSGTSSDASEDEGRADDLARALEAADPNNPLVLKWKQSKARKAVIPGQAAIERVRELLGAGAPAANSPTPRQLVEHLAILDTLRTTSIDEAAADLTSIGDAPGADNLRSAGEFALRDLGIGELKVVSDFPIALCAVGCTRITRDPGRSILTPFETSDSAGRIPLYIMSSETEGIYFQLTRHAL